MAKSKRYAPAAGRCACCNRACRAGFGFCAECNYAATSAEWPIALGHAIARFVRRTEVHAMREIVLDALDNSESVLVEDYVAATRCLRLLAEMAMGEL
jgi:hypothetical protein